MFVLLIIGILLMYLAKSQTKRESGGIFIGLALIFAGMMFMSDGLDGIDKRIFEALFASCANILLLGVAIGTVVTAIIQSSSASVGILQAVAGTGAITLGGAIPIILGQNIGTCITAIVSSLGATKTAKKASVLHLTFNITGTVIFFVVLYFICPFVVPGWSNLMASNVTSATIADFHSVFNITTTIILLPFVELLLKFINLFSGNDKKKNESSPSQKLDERFLHSPAIALGQCRDVILSMLELAKKNITFGEIAVLEKNANIAADIKVIEKQVDTLESELAAYLVKIAEKDLSETENKLTMGYMHIISDIERISDHASNMSDIASVTIREDTQFSHDGVIELQHMFRAVYDLLDTTIQTVKTNNTDLAASVEPKEQVIDLFKATLKNKHLERLTAKQCTIESGIVFLEMINNLERVADHCSNIGVAILQIHSREKIFNPHEYLKIESTNCSQEYTKTYKAFMEKYYNPLMK